MLLETSLDSIRDLPSSVWSKLWKFFHDRLVSAIVATCCVILRSEWSFLSALFELLFTLLANVPLSALRKYSLRRAKASHRFIPPSDYDSRSPCPALNALSNHSILPHDGCNISAFQLAVALREHYYISLPLAILLSVGGTFMCGRNFKIDLQDLARHDVLEHNGSLTHADAVPGCRYAPVTVDKNLLEHLLDVSPDSDILTFGDLVTARANRDATLRRPLNRVHTLISRGAVALAVQTLGDKEGNIPKQYIREWFGEERLPHRWTRPTTAVGLRRTTRISNWVGITADSIFRQRTINGRLGRAGHNAS